MIKPIETRYAGCRFRSRLEARWAVLLDALGVVWEYEPQGFELPSGRYLPDFRVQLKTGPTVWIEVKPFQDDGIDPRWKEFARNIGQPFAVAYGMHRPGDDCTRQHGYRSFAVHRGLLRAKAFPGGRLGGVSAGTDAAYTVASSARFEFGESGGPAS